MLPILSRVANRQIRHSNTLCRLPLLMVNNRYSQAAAQTSEQQAPKKSEPRISLTKDGDIAIVTLNRERKMNALDMPMFDAIVNTVNQLQVDRTLRCVIIRGSGSAFCSGLDFKSVMSNPLNINKLLKRKEGKASNLAQDVGYLWRNLPVPVIACLHGVCFGGGLQIALGADFRFTTPDCQLSLMEAKWGLIPDMSVSVTLRELCPMDIAKELSMTGRIFTADEAKQYNLVTRICQDPFQEAMKLAKEICTRSPDSVAASKVLFNNLQSKTDEEALKLETELQKLLLPSWNQLAAATAALNKSSPRYIRRKRVWERYAH